MRSDMLSVDLWRLPHLIGVFCLVFLLVKVARLLNKRWEQQKALLPYPGPSSHWLFGHVHEFTRTGSDLVKCLVWANTYPYAYPLWFGPFIAFLSICHPDYAKTVLNSSEPKDDLVYQFLTPWIGNGLLISEGQKWFRHRRMLTRGFHFDILKPYVKVMADSTKIMLDKWESLCCESGSLEIYQHVSLLTLDNIMKCAFSYKSNCQISSDNEYTKAVYDLTYLCNHRFHTFPYHSNLIFHLSPHGYRFRKACRLAHRHTDEVIQQRKKTLQSEAELEKISGKRYLDFLDILLCTQDNEGKGLTDKEIRAEVDTFMFEGHDTTASGISWILYTLAQNPHHQDLCRDEIQQLLQEQPHIDWEFLGKLPYTTMCIKECLRLHPPVPSIARRLTKSLHFPDGRSLPAGSLVGINLFCIHKNASVWENPEHFDPLRFSPENSAQRHSHAFLPFSAGQRNCIGKHFAMNEMKIVLALTLNRFRLAVDEEKLPIEIPQIVLRSMNGIHLFLSRLD